MFGTKLRTWMEAHIVRSKKKKDRKGKGEKGFDSNSNSPRNGSHRSPALHQVSMFRCRPYETLFWSSFAATVSSIFSEMKTRIAEQTSEETATASHSLFLSPSASVDSRFPLAANCYPIGPYTGRTRESILSLYQAASTAQLSSISVFRAIFWPSYILDRLDSQVHPVDSPSRNVDEIRLHGEDGNRCGTVTASSGTSAGTGSVNLSSPESAYSTGYSTDGTSPGTSYPPEYYINIRTGTHYFQSNANANAGTATGNYSNNNNNNSSSKNNNNNNNGRPKKPSDSSDFPVACASLLSARSRHGRFEGNVEPSVSGCVTMFSTATVTMDKLGKDVVRSNEYGRTSKVRIPNVTRDRFNGEEQTRVFVLLDIDSTVVAK